MGFILFKGGIMNNHYGLSEKAAATLYVLGVVHDLMDKGLMEGPRVMTAEELAVYRQMEADGYRVEQGLFDTIMWAIL
jgi:hypothetical protein